MQWMITYGLRPEGAWRKYDQNVAGVLSAFADWTPPEGVELVAFVHRADGKGAGRSSNRMTSPGPARSSPSTWRSTPPRSSRCSRLGRWRREWVPG